MEIETNEAKSSDANNNSKGVERIAAFSDAVFAVAITLLVLNINIPEGLSTVEMRKAIVQLWPTFASFIISFFIIGVFWVSHHAVFKVIERSSSGLLWLNLLFLMCIVFLPFPVSLLSDYGDRRTALIIYATSMAVTALALGVLWWYAAGKKRLVSEDLDPSLFRHVLLVYLNFAIIFLLSIGISFLSVTAAQYFWLLLIPNSVLIERLRRKELKGRD